jgi:glycosyltransferase involved in cell wall biosynthesis
MRLLVASHHASHVGGVETYVEAVVPALAASGHDVAVWHEQGGAGDRAGAPAVRRWFNEAQPGAVAEIRRWQPDLVFSQGLRSPELERELMTLAPAVTFAHSYLGTCVSGTKMHAFPAPACCTRRFGAACLALYYPRRCGGLSPATAYAMYRRQAARLKLFERYRRILVASRHMADEYARHGLADKTRVVSLPVTAEAASGRPRLAANAWRLLYLGRLEWTKGPDIAIEAAARVARRVTTPVSLVIAGSGSMVPALRAAADRARASAATLTYEFTGAVTAEARGALIDRSDLLLVPSRWPEPFGLVGNEAGARGVPAVAFAAGGIPDWLSDGENGRLVRGGPDAAAFAQAIVEVLSNPERAAAMGDAARAVARRHSLAAHLRELDTIFHEAIGAGS